MTPQEISDFFRAGRRALHRLSPVPNFSDLFTLSPKTSRALLLSFDCDIPTPLLEDLMQRRHRRTNPRKAASRHNRSRWAAMKASSYPLSHSANRPGSATADWALEFGRVRVLLRQRQLLADGVRLELGTRAFDLLVVLLEADGSLVTKEELLGRVWPGIVVSEGNLKVQVSALRRALGADRIAIRTEFGRGYRFTGVLCSITAADACHTRAWAKLPSALSLFPVRPRA
jgi:DNA-binding winged helix-turn-helix (wHTH) protein